MLKVDNVIELLKEKNLLTFEQIWKQLRKELIKELKIINLKDEAKLQADLLISMSKNEDLVCLTKKGKNLWDLRRNYSYKEFKELKQKALGVELMKMEVDSYEDEDSEEN